MFQNGCCNKINRRKAQPVSEEKRYYAVCDGCIAEFPAGLLYRPSGATQHSIASETSYVFNEQRIPAWLAEAAVAHWKLLRKHPNAERKLQAWDVMEEKKWRVFWWPFSGKWAVSDSGGKPVDYTEKEATNSYSTPLAAIEAAIAATEKKAELAEARANSMTPSGVPEVSANYIRMDIVRQTIDKIGDAVRELGEKVAGGKK